MIPYNSVTQQRTIRILLLAVSCIVAWASWCGSVASGSRPAKQRDKASHKSCWCTRAAPVPCRLEREAFSWKVRPGCTCKATTDARERVRVSRELPTRQPSSIKQKQTDFSITAWATPKSKVELRKKTVLFAGHADGQSTAQEKQSSHSILYDRSGFHQGSYPQLQMSMAGEYVSSPNRSSGGRYHNVITRLV